MSYKNNISQPAEVKLNESNSSILRPSFKTRLKNKNDKRNYECAELETVIKWNNLELEMTVNGKNKKILDNVSGEVNNLEIQVSDSNFDL